MDCKEFEKDIPDFMQDRLDNRTLRKFLAHMDNCSGCKEEFSIHFVIHRGVERLETGETFNLGEEMKLELEKAQKALKRRTRLSVCAYTTEIIALTLTAATAVCVLLFWC